MKEGTGIAQRIIPVDPGDLGLAPGEKDAPGQRPYAAVLGCSDARVPIELIFNEGPNDLFVVRVAGNGLGGEVLGSLKYAIDHLGESLKLVVVLGHSGCGAVTAAVDVFLNPKDYLSLAVKHSLRNILDRLLLVVHAAAKRIAAIRGPEAAHRSGYREALIEAAIVSNAALTAYTIQQEIGSVDPRGIHAAYGVYLLGEHQVWAPRSGSTECAGLAYPTRRFRGLRRVRRRSGAIGSDRGAARRRIAAVPAASVSRGPQAPQIACTGADRATAVTPDRRAAKA